MFTGQAYGSNICAYFCIGFIDFMLNNKRLVDFNNFIFMSNFKKADETDFNIFNNLTIE